MSLSFEEVSVLYRLLLAEGLDRMKVVIQLLPRILTPIDARLFINKALGGDLEERERLKSTIGNHMFNIYTGTTNGYYSLNLSEERDHRCLEKLYEIDETDTTERQRKKLGDTSQFGNWIAGFRNTYYNHNPIILTKEWFMNIPKTGLFEFDFVRQQTVEPGEPQISDARLLKILNGLNLVPEHDRGKVLKDD
jgi:hypothetical protein